MYRIRTAGQYLAKDDVTNTKIVEDRLYKAEEINGWFGVAHTVLVTNNETGEAKNYFPQQPISVIVPKKKKKSKKK